MYETLLPIHSIVRWVVLVTIVVMLSAAYSGLLFGRSFSRLDRVLLSIATMTSHTQLLVGMALYFSSPFVSLFWDDPVAGASNLGLLYFGVIHVLGMVTSIVLMTVGGSLARKGADDRAKFRSIAIYWTIALVVILAIIPWPFSPLANRPLIR